MPEVVLEQLRSRVRCRRRRGIEAGVDDGITWAGTTRPLGELADLLLLDLDGVVYVGAAGVPGAAQSLAQARERGLTMVFVTNNASRPPQDVAEHLTRLGIDASEQDVLTSAQAGATSLAERLPSGAPVLAVGGPGVAAALREAGLEPVDRFTEGVLAVLQGYGPDVGWRSLAEATYAVRAGATWVATNCDATVPTPRGAAPGNGQLVGVVARTTGVDPEVTGKPGPELFRRAVDAAGARRALVVGDRLNTDIAGAMAAGLPSLLVLTGISGVHDLLAATPAERPTYVARDLAGLWSNQPQTAEVDGVWVCGRARARVSHDVVVLEGGANPLEDLRVATAAAWSAVDRGARIDTREVAGRLSDALGRD